MQIIKYYYNFTCLLLYYRFVTVIIILGISSRYPTIKFQISGSYNYTSWEKIRMWAMHSNICLRKTYACTSNEKTFRWFSTLRQIFSSSKIVNSEGFFFGRGGEGGVGLGKKLSKIHFVEYCWKSIFFLNY